MEKFVTRSILKTTFSKIPETVSSITFKETIIDCIQAHTVYKSGNVWFYQVYFRFFFLNHS